jgi:hypothetical protein
MYHTTIPHQFADDDDDNNNLPQVEAKNKVIDIVKTRPIVMY